MITKTKLKNYLIELYPNKFDRKKSLESYVINNIDNPEYKLKDLVNHGCISGCFSPLIYNYDCKKFFIRYEEQIWELIEEFKESTGQTLGQFIDSFQYKIEDETNFKTYLSWFAVEETAFKIINHFEEI